MSLKTIVRLDEGPLDFIRGASAAVGQKMSQSAPVQAAKDVIAAGKAASLAGELDKAIAVLTKSILAMDNMTGRVSEHQKYTLSNFLSDTHGTSLDEGLWDFMKGAGSAVKSKVEDNLSNYANRPSFLKDIYVAGKQASANADAASKIQQVEKIKAQVSSQLTNVLNMLKPLGTSAATRLKTSLQKVAGNAAPRIYEIIAKNAQQAGLSL